MSNFHPLEFVCRGSEPQLQVVIFFFYFSALDIKKWPHAWFILVYHIHHCKVCFVYLSCLCSYWYPWAFWPLRAGATSATYMCGECFIWRYGIIIRRVQDVNYYSKASFWSHPDLRRLFSPFLRGMQDRLSTNSRDISHAHHANEINVSFPLFQSNTRGGPIRDIKLRRSPNIKPPLVQVLISKMAPALTRTRRKKDHHQIQNNAVTSETESSTNLTVYLFSRKCHDIWHVHRRVICIRGAASAVASQNESPFWIGFQIALQPFFFFFNNFIYKPHIKTFIHVYKLFIITNNTNNKWWSKNKPLLLSSVVPSKHETPNQCWPVLAHRLWLWTTNTKSTPAKNRAPAGIPLITHNYKNSLITNI